MEMRSKVNQYINAFGCPTVEGSKCDRSRTLRTLVDILRRWHGSGKSTLLNGKMLQRRQKSTSTPHKTGDKRLETSRNNEELPTQNDLPYTGWGSLQNLCASSGGRQIDNAL